MHIVPWIGIRIIITDYQSLGKKEKKREKTYTHQECCEPTKNYNNVGAFQMAHSIWGSNDLVVITKYVLRLKAKFCHARYQIFCILHAGNEFCFKIFFFFHFSKKGATNRFKKEKLLTNKIKTTVHWLNIIFVALTHTHNFAHFKRNIENCCPLVNCHIFYLSKNWILLVERIKMNFRYSFVMQKFNRIIGYASDP